MTEVKLIINEKEVSCNEGDRLIDVAQREGEYIPRFCYHPSLSVVASCRMCLVEIDGIRKTQPACSTVVSNGMVVKTQSKKVIEDQKAIMQFLLVNHPLHCPICDQAGECDLQDTVMGYGVGYADAKMQKRTVLDEDLGPLVATDMSLCIHCTRCVRFGHEIAGIPDLGMMGRSDGVAIGTYLEKGLRSELSGNVIDLCPVGALTSKPFKFRGRSWNFHQKAGISVHDCLGSNLYYHICPKGYDHLADVMRVVPKPNADINDIWLSDRDRFSYQGIQSSERLLHPKIKKDNQWVDIGWDDALAYVVDQITMLTPEDKMKSGAWFSPQATMEEGFLAQSLFRDLGIHSLDYRIGEYTALEERFLKPCRVNVHDIDQYNVIVLLGCNIRYEQSLMAYHIKEAVALGSQVLSLGAIEHDYVFKHEHILVSPQQLARKLYTVLLEKEEGGHPLMIQPKILFILGQEALTHPLAEDLKHIVYDFCFNKAHEYCYLTQGPNALGLKGVGCLPAQGPTSKEVKVGLDYCRMLNEDMKLMWLHQVDPMYDVSDMKKAMSMLSQAFVISLSSYDTPGVRAVSDLMLPLALPVETSGHYSNYQGKCQFFDQAIRPLGEAKMGWSIYDIVATLLGVKTFDHTKLGKDMVAKFEKIEWDRRVEKPKKPEVLEGAWVKVGLTSWVRADAQVRHAKALGEAYPKSVDKWVHPESLGSLSRFKMSDKVAKNTIIEEKKGTHYEIMEDL